ncbi:MAG: hypothetical protein ABIE84_07225, partial [bacterium]
FDGAIRLKLKDKYLSFEEVTDKDIRSIAADQKAAREMIKKARIYYPAPKNHPWRSFKYSAKRRVAYV